MINYVSVVLNYGWDTFVTLPWLPSQPRYRGDDVTYGRDVIFARITTVLHAPILLLTDKSCEMKATTAKLIGNSAFGSCITNKDKFRKVALKKVNDRSAYAGAYTSDELVMHSKEEIVSLNRF